MIKKINLYFAYESRDSLKSVGLFLSLKITDLETGYGTQR